MDIFKKIRLSIIAFLIILPSLTFADIFQDFEAWTTTFSFGTTTNADGWIIVDGTIRQNFIGYGQPRDLKCAWLNDVDVNTNSHLQTVLFPTGIDTVHYYARNRAGSPGNAEIALQTSTDLVSWVTHHLQAVFDDDWQSFTNTVEEPNPVYLRFLKTQDSLSDHYLGLDDIAVIEAPGLFLSSLRTSPSQPELGDSIDILIDVNAGSSISNMTLSAFYRQGEAGSYASAPMVQSTGNTYHLSAPIPNIGGGFFNFYIEANFWTGDAQVLWEPPLGPAEPASRFVESPIANLYDRQLFPSSRMTPLIISEIMYHPADHPSGADHAFIELFNTEHVPHSLSGYRLSGDIDFTFPSGLSIPPRGHIIVAGDPVALQNLHQTSGILGPYAGSLSNGGGTLRLRHKQGAILLEVGYSDDPPWPIAADGAGHSLVLHRPDFGENDVRAWGISAERGGSLRAHDVYTNTSRSSIQINEVLAHTDLPDVDYIEIFNSGITSVDMLGFALTENVHSNKYLFPSNSIIAPQGYLLLTQTNLGFSLSSHGDSVFLTDLIENRVVDAVRFGATQNGVAQGRTPDGAPDGLQTLSQKTPGTTNAQARVHSVVINEIMYHPITEDGNDEYVELYNHGTTTVDVSYWRFTDGISYVIPAGTHIPAGGFLVIAENAVHMIERYAALNRTNTLGNFSGSLSDSGERIILARPDNLSLPNSDFVHVDSVTYNDGPRWGTWTDGGGSSLELCDASSDNRLPPNWAGSDETQKAPWVLVEHTGKLDNGSRLPEELHLLLLGQGECLVDDIEIIKGGSPLVFNGDFEGGLTGWLIQGNHQDSVLETTEGYSSSQSLHLIAESDGDTASNRAEIDVAGLTTVDDNITIRARVRWLAGHRDILLRLLGNWLETSGTLTVPSNLGTPGEPNSCVTTNSGPAITDTQHSPLMPAANATVTITTRVHDHDSVASVTLRYRVDPSTTIQSIAMNDSGTSPDLRAGDGVYSATLPGQAANAVVAFHIDAIDTDAAATQFPESNTSGEALIMFGQSLPAGGFGTYRFWITESTRARWQSQVKLSNKLMDTTMIYNDVRAIYNASIRYRGSSFIRPTGNPLSVNSAYSFKAPKDDPLLGTRSFNLDYFEGGRDPTYQRERFCFWIAEQLGHPSSYQRYVHVYVNQSKRGKVYGDVSFPNRDWLKTWYPDDVNGSLFEIDDWFEYDDGLSHSSVNATIQKFLTGSTYKKARYRWSWEKKVQQASDDSYQDLFTLAEAMNLPLGDVYDQRVSALVDFESWMRAFAVRHAIADWDGYGYSRGKNSYTYNPVKSGWQILLWDMDFSLGAGSRGPSDPIFSGINDPILGTKFYVNPRFRRAYVRALQTIANTLYAPEMGDPIMDAQYQAFVTNSVVVDSPAAIRTWIDQRGVSLTLQIDVLDTSAFTMAETNIISATTPTTLTGEAPLQVKHISINGEPYPVKWTDLTHWEVDVSVTSAFTQLSVAALTLGEVTLATLNASITYSGTLPIPGPVDALVINEIHYDPTLPAAEFIELYNASSSNTFDLSGYRIDGVDMDFGKQTLIGPGEYRVAAESAAQYANIYTNAEVLIGEYKGDLDDDGERLRLLQPAGTNQWTVLDDVRYDNNLPWPLAAAGTGPSLQLADSAQDNRRAGTWFAVTNGTPRYTPGAPNNVPNPIPALPPIWINEVLPSNTTTLADNAGEFDPWIELYNDGDAVVDLSNCVLTDTLNTPALWTFPTGTIINAKSYLLVWCDATTAQTTSTNLHASFQLSTPTGLVALAYVDSGSYYNLDMIAYALDAADVSFGTSEAGDPYQLQLFPTPTPAAPNNAVSTLYDIRINEWVADNTSLLDPSDNRFDDWFEIYNPGTNDIDLTGLFLTDDLTDPRRYQIPPGYVLPARGFMLIWADDDTGDNAPGTNLHVNFSLARDGEAIGIFAPDFTVIDSVVFGAQTNNISEGRLPDGNSSTTQFPQATPGLSNAPVVLAAPTFTAISPTQQNHLFLTWDSDAGATYRLETIANVMQTNWVMLDSVTATSVVTSATDTNLPSVVLRYYRLLRLP